LDALTDCNWNQHVAEDELERFCIHCGKVGQLRGQYNIRRHLKACRDPKGTLQKYLRDIVRDYGKDGSAGTSTSTTQTIRSGREVRVVTTLREILKEIEKESNETDW
jgi:hypothetical protein